jgi:4-hydroxy-tetrahydrodipicolinate reductase
MAAPVRVAISGAGGRMGVAIAEMIDDSAELELVGGIGRTPGEMRGGAPVVTTPDAGELLSRAGVIVDVSAPEQLRSLLRAHGSSLGDRALVVGTTGLDAEDERLLDERAADGPVLVAANFGVGVNVLLGLVRQAAAALPDWDVEIVETHHRRKEDAPSGTALALGAAVAQGRSVSLERVRLDGRSGRPGARPAGEIGFHAIRGGEVVGEHTVHLLGELERVEITHRATDRALFAAGAVRAVRWIAGRTLAATPCRRSRLRLIHPSPCTREPVHPSLRLAERLARPGPPRAARAAGAGRRARRRGRAGA